MSKPKVHIRHGKQLFVECRDATGDPEMVAIEKALLAAFEEWRQTRTDALKAALVLCIKDNGDILVSLDPEADEIDCQEAVEDFRTGGLLGENFWVVNLLSQHFTNY